MKRFLLALALLIALPASADQYLYSYGWTGGNGSTGQCLTSNGVSAAPSFQTCGGGGGGSGTVTSVGLTVPSWLSVTGSPVTTSGTLAITGTATGTGNVVLATSPTLVTPALGTPSAAVLTNATGLPDGALSANVPLLNAANNFTGTTQTISNTEPRAIFDATGGGTNGKFFDFDFTPTLFSIRTRADADGAGVNILTATRTASSTAITNLTFGNTTNNPSYTFNGTGTTTFNGGITGTTLTLTSFTATGSIFKAPTVQSTGTKFTAAGTGCTVGATSGGAAAGTFTLAAGPCTSVAITINGATGSTASNGWTCQAHDRTAPTVLIGGESSSTTTTATITIPAGAGTTDVISFSCTGY